MPSKNSVKQYLENAYYHIYNRGVEKRTIFLDSQDYNVFQQYLRDYLQPKDINALQNQLTDPQTGYKEKDKIKKLLRLNNFFGKIEVVAYCLMSNHFHFLIKQAAPVSIDEFMNSLATRYTMYFNRKYKRVGSLYQDVYKAVPVETDEQLLHLSRYIHKQALATQGDALQGYKPSSYPEYMGQRVTEWVQPEEVLSFFSKTNPKLGYAAFVGENDSEESASLLNGLALEDDH